MSEEATTNPTPMRLRAEPPRVTRLSRKMLAGAGAVALLGIGGALIYALQTRDMSGNGEELYSTENRATADGLAGLPKDYTGPVLGPALPGDLGGPILDAQNRGQPVVPPAMVTPQVDPEEQRRLAEEEAAGRYLYHFDAVYLYIKGAACRQGAQLEGYRCADDIAMTGTAAPDKNTHVVGLRFQAKGRAVGAAGYGIARR